MDKNKKETLDLSKFKEEVLTAYPPKIAKKRGKSIIMNDPDAIPEIQANVRTIPGIITQRGCTYAGCKGVVLGPTRDIINITHGPIGCGFYSWLTRRNQTRTTSNDQENFIPYTFSTDMQDSNIVFGGEEKLKVAIREAIELFNPKGIAIFSNMLTCLKDNNVFVITHKPEKLENIARSRIIIEKVDGYSRIAQ